MLTLKILHLPTGQEAIVNWYENIPTTTEQLWPLVSTVCERGKCPALSNEISLSRGCKVCAWSTHTNQKSIEEFFIEEI